MTRPIRAQKRDRAKALLKAGRIFTAPQLADAAGASLQSVYRWLPAWRDLGLICPVGTVRLDGKTMGQAFLQWRWNTNKGRT